MHFNLILWLLLYYNDRTINYCVFVFQPKNENMKYFFDLLCLIKNIQQVE